jgi:hypothetical protein
VLQAESKVRSSALTVVAADDGRFESLCVEMFGDRSQLFDPVGPRDVPAVERVVRGLRVDQARHVVEAGASVARRGVRFVASRRRLQLTQGPYQSLGADFLSGQCGADGPV